MPPAAQNWEGACGPLQTEQGFQSLAAQNLQGDNKQNGHQKGSRDKSEHGCTMEYSRAIAQNKEWPCALSGNQLQEILLVLNSG